MVLTGYPWVLLGFSPSLNGSEETFTGFYWILPGFTECDWVSLGIYGFYWVLVSVAGL